MAGMTFGDRNVTTYRGGRLLSAVVALAGLWQIAAPFVLNFADQQTLMQNSIVSGGLLLIFGALAFIGAAYWSHTIVRAFDVLAGLTGFWLLISPWVLGYEANAPAFWSAIVVGLVGLIGGVLAAVKQDENTFVGA